MIKDALGLEGIGRSIKMREDSIIASERRIAIKEAGAHYLAMCVFFSC